MPTAYIVDAVRTPIGKFAGALSSVRPDDLAAHVLRELLRRGRFSFDEAVKDADRVTVCVTVFALLELYKRGEAAWEQDEPFGPITVTADAPQRAAA